MRVMRGVELALATPGYGLVNWISDLNPNCTPSFLQWKTLQTNFYCCHRYGPDADHPQVSKERCPRICVLLRQQESWKCNVSEMLISVCLTLQGVSGNLQTCYICQHLHGDQQFAKEVFSGCPDAFSFHVSVCCQCLLLNLEHCLYCKNFAFITVSSLG